MNPRRLLHIHIHRCVSSVLLLFLASALLCVQPLFQYSLISSARSRFDFIIVRLIPPPSSILSSCCVAAAALAGTSPSASFSPHSSFQGSAAQESQLPQHLLKYSLASSCSLTWSCSTNSWVKHLLPAWALQCSSHRPKWSSLSHYTKHRSAQSRMNKAKTHNNLPPCFCIIISWWILPDPTVCSEL